MQEDSDTDASDTEDTQFSVEEADLTPFELRETAQRLADIGTERAFRSNLHKRMRLLQCLIQDVEHALDPPYTLFGTCSIDKRGEPCTDIRELADKWSESFRGWAAMCKALEFVDVDENLEEARKRVREVKAVILNTAKDIQRLCATCLRRTDGRRLRKHHDEWTKRVQSGEEITRRLNPFVVTHFENVKQFTGK